MGVARSNVEKKIMQVLYGKLLVTWYQGRCGLNIRGWLEMIPQVGREMKGVCIVCGR